MADHLEVTLLRAEGDIQLLQTKMEELQSARITQAKGGADRIQMLGKWSIEKKLVFYSIMIKYVYTFSICSICKINLSFSIYFKFKY